MFTENLIEVSIFLSGKDQLLVIIVLFLMIVGFSLLGVKLAWGGLFLALVGFFLRKPTRSEARGTGAISIDSTKSLKAQVQGPASVLMILGGIFLATFDLWNKGPETYNQLKQGTMLITKNLSLDTTKMMEGINHDLYKRTIQNRFEDEKNILNNNVERGSTETVKAFSKEIIGLIDSIESEQTFKKGVEELHVIRYRLDEAEKNDSTNKMQYVPISELLDAIDRRIEHTDPKTGMFNERQVNANR